MVPLRFVWKITFDAVLGQQESIERKIVPVYNGGEVDVSTCRKTRTTVFTHLTDSLAFVQFEYDREVYWPQLMKTCRERRAGAFTRWKEAGGVVGISELDFKMTLDMLKKE